MRCGIGMDCTLPCILRPAHSEAYVRVHFRIYCCLCLACTHTLLDAIISIRRLPSVLMCCCCLFLFFLSFFLSPWASGPSSGDAVDGSACCNLDSTCNSDSARNLDSTRNLVVCRRIALSLNHVEISAFPARDRVISRRDPAYSLSKD